MVQRSCCLLTIEIQQEQLGAHILPSQVLILHHILPLFNLRLNTKTKGEQKQLPWLLGDALGLYPPRDEGESQRCQKGPVGTSTPPWLHTRSELLSGFPKPWQSLWDLSFSIPTSRKVSLRPD